jgi:serine/threonine-protein kinase
LKENGLLQLCDASASSSFGSSFVDRAAVDSEPRSLAFFCFGRPKEFLEMSSVHTSETPARVRQSVWIAGRYALSREIAAGGMGTVHFGRVLGAAGFRRTVAIKRLHPHLAKDPDFFSMFIDEARLAARVRHPNVVGTIDVAHVEEELLLVLEYVHGESLSKLAKAHRESAQPIALPIVSAIMTSVLYGLHAAHEARNEQGEVLGLVHRDVSPQNVMLGTDGAARVLDFGIAKAVGRVQATRDGQIKGKLTYMAPEQLAGEPIDRRADIYAASVILWELLANAPLFRAESDAALLREAMQGHILPPGRTVPTLPAELDAITMRGLERDSASRYGSAREMAVALESAIAPATPRQVGEWVEATAHEALARRSNALATFESLSLETHATPDSPRWVEAEGVAVGLDPPTTYYVRADNSPERGKQTRVRVAPDPSSAAGPITQLSSASSSHTQTYRAPPAYFGWGLVALAAVVAAVSGGGAALWLTRSNLGETRATSPATTIVATPTSPAPVPTSSPDSRTSPTTQASVAAEAPRPPAPPPPPATAATTPPRPATPVYRPPAPGRAEKPVATARSGTGSACNPPWTVDDEGIRHPKPECL